MFESDGHVADGFWVDHQPISLPLDSNNILVLHSWYGGLISGDVHTYNGFECYLSRLLNMIVLHAEYRLAPESPLPAAIDDAVAIYHALLRRNILPSQIIIPGDSAGGGLTLLILQSLIARQIPVPQGVILLSA